MRVYTVTDVDASQLASLMIGHQIDPRLARRVETDVASESVLVVEDVHGKWLNGVDMVVKRGEIVGIAGVLGSGREELPYILASATRATMGDIYIDGKVLPQGLPREAQALGIGFVPADRLREGVIVPYSMKENMTLSGIEDLATAGIIRRRSESDLVSLWTEKVGLVPAEPERLLPNFSGGNQQKIVLARVLSLVPKVLVMSEPTAGVDIGAREALYDVIHGEVENGRLTVVVASSDIQDLVALCSRVVVLQNGRVTSELVGDDINYGTILRAMEGVVLQGNEIDDAQ